jgi:hypothetical protein
VLHLLGGPPRCGKSTFATRAAGRRGLGWLSTDVIRSVVNLHAPLYDDDGLLRPHGPEADRFFASFERAVESCAYVAEHYLLEGVGFYPRHVERLAPHVERRVVFVGQSKVELADVLAHEGRNLWHRGLDDETLAQLPAWIETWSAELEAECSTFGYPYVDLAAGSFADRYDEVERLLF